MTAGVIAGAQDHPSLNPDTAYLGGLLHDIGRFVMFENDPAELGAIDESGWGTPAQLIAAERDICGFDHAELGWHLCRLWGIPQLLTEVIRDHHRYVQDCISSSVDKRTRLVGIIQMADCLSVLSLVDEKLRTREEQEIIDLIEKGCVSPVWDQPPMQPEELAAFVPAILEESNRMLANLGLGGGS